MQKIDLLNAKFIIRKNRIVSGMVPIQMQITIEGERVFISTGQKIEIELWDLKSCRAIGKYNKVRVLNEYLEKMSVDVVKAFNEIKSIHDDISAEMLRDKLTGKSIDRRKYLIECCQIYNSSFEKLVGIEIGKITFGSGDSVGHWGQYNNSTFTTNTDGDISINRSKNTLLRNHTLSRDTLNHIATLPLGANLYVFLRGI